MKQESRFFGKEYIAALQKHYPERVARFDTIDQELHIGPVHNWVRNFDTFGVDASTRYQPITDRPWSSEMSAWAVSGGQQTDVRLASAYGSYKGLIRLKPAIDLVLYSNLIWELQPRNILEFGSLQGGSALWFADQLQVLCGKGEVHSL